MEFQIGDIVKLKKAHPCGINGMGDSESWEWNFV